MNIEKATIGKKGTINRIEGDIGFINKMMSVGIIQGSNIEILKNERKHPVLLYTRDTVLALNRKDASNIYMEVQNG